LFIFGPQWPILLSIKTNILFFLIPKKVPKKIFVKCLTIVSIIFDNKEFRKSKMGFNEFKLSCNDFFSGHFKT
jgi:hypothetical protein